MISGSDDEILAGTFDGIFRTNNKGDTWEQIGLEGRVVRPLAVNNKGDIFAIATEGYSRAVFRSMDNGNTWTLTRLNNIYAVSTAINSKDDVFVGTAYDGGIFRSTSKLKI